MLYNNTYSEPKPHGFSRFLGSFFDLKIAVFSRFWYYFGTQRSQLSRGFGVILELKTLGFVAAFGLFLKPKIGSFAAVFGAFVEPKTRGFSRVLTPFLEPKCCGSVAFFGAVAESETRGFVAVSGAMCIPQYMVIWNIPEYSGHSGNLPEFRNIPEYSGIFRNLR